MCIIASVNDGFFLSVFIFGCGVLNIIIYISFVFQALSLTCIFYIFCRLIERCRHCRIIYIYYVFHSGANG